MSKQDAPEIDKGWDRDIDFIPIKEKLLDELNSKHNLFLRETDRYEKQIILNKLIYIMIALIQLRNGSRISEACNAMQQFINADDLTQKVLVKIAKSEGMKYNNRTKKKQMSKPRYRKIMFPDWIDENIFLDVKEAKPICLNIKDSLLRQRVRDYLLHNFDCNTHSLRYACINHLMYTQKRPMADIAKFVGHSSVNQLVTYTQQKNCDQIFDLDL